MTLPLTHNTINLSRKNNMNITSVENEYDAAMKAAAEAEKANPIQYAINELVSCAWSRNWRWADFAIDTAKKDGTWETIKAGLKAEVLEKLERNCTACF